MSHFVRISGSAQFEGNLIRCHVVLGEDRSAADPQIIISDVGDGAFRSKRSDIIDHTVQAPTDQNSAVTVILYASAVACRTG